MAEKVQPDSTMFFRKSEEDEAVKASENLSKEALVEAANETTELNKELE